MITEGASDYLGLSLLKTSSRLDARRFKNVLMLRKVLSPSINDSAAKENGKVNADESASFLKTGIKFPPENSFPGWKKIRSGSTANFYLLYCSLQGNVALDTRFGDKFFAQVCQRFAAFLNKKFQEGEGLCWMNSGRDCLFLLPPKAKCVETIIETCIRMIVSAPLIVMETLNLTIPVNFVFALHYGSLNYHPPGKTGTVVSDAVNYIFHLGPKKAEPGRITVSSDIPEGTIPKFLEDLFVSAGEFEGRKIWHSKKFSYSKPWL
jgi:hypothetical protein